MAAGSRYDACWLLEAGLTTATLMYSVALDLTPSRQTLTIDWASESLLLDIPPRSTAATAELSVYFGGLLAKLHQELLVAPLDAFKPVFIGMACNVA